MTYGIAVDQRDADAPVQQVLEVLQQGRVCPVARVVEALVDLVAGARIVEVDAEGVLGEWGVEPVGPVLGRDLGLEAVLADVIGAVGRDDLVGALDEVAADGHGLGALFAAQPCAAVRLGAVVQLGGAARLGEAEGRLGELVRRLVDGPDAVRVVVREFGVEWHLDFGRDEAIDDAERVHLQLAALGLARPDQVVLLLKVVKESGTIVPAVALRPEVEGPRSHFRVESGQCLEECLENLPYSYSGERRGAVPERVRVCIAPIGICIGRRETSIRVNSSLYLVSVGEAHTQRLRQEEHVALLVPRVGVEFGHHFMSDITGTKFY